MINHKNIFKEIFVLALPVIIQDISMVILQLTDSAMVGHLGAVAIASIAINTSPMWLFNGIGTAFAVGAGALVARSIGADEKGKAGQIAVGSWWISVLAGAVISLLLLFFAEFLTTTMGASEDVLHYASQYVRIVGMGYLFQFSTLLICAVLRSTGDFKTPMLLNIVGGVLNIVGNFFLIYPTRLLSIGFADIRVPGANLGVIGAAISTMCSVMFVSVLAFLCVKLKCKEVSFEIFKVRKVHRDLWRKMFVISGPIFLERVVTSIGQMFFFRSVATLGTVVVAANALAIQIEAISYTPAYGFAAAASTLTALSLGEGNKARARKIIKSSWIFSLAYMTFCGTLFFFIPQVFLKLFTSSEEVIAAGVTLVSMLLIMQPFFSATIVIGESLRGSGDTKYVMLTALLCKGVIRISATFAFVYLFKMGIMGAWLAMVIDQCVQGILIICRYRSAKWEVIGGV